MLSVIAVMKIERLCSIKLSARTKAANVASGRCEFNRLIWLIL